jgi:hypothetical protein
LYYKSAFKIRNALNNKYDVNNFNIYVAPSDYDMTKINFSDFKEVDTLSDDNNTLEMWSLNKIKKSFCRQIINVYDNKRKTDITDEDINNIITIFRNNKEPLLTFIYLIFISVFVKIETKTNLTINNGIGSDMHKLFSYDNTFFTSSIRKYLPGQKDIENIIDQHNESVKL